MMHDKVTAKCKWHLMTECKWKLIIYHTWSWHHAGMRASSLYDMIYIFMAEPFQDMLELQNKVQDTFTYLYCSWAKHERGFQMEKWVFSTTSLKRTVLENKGKINYEKNPKPTNMKCIWICCPENNSKDLFYSCNGCKLVFCLSFKEKGSFLSSSITG